jgi:putative ABC transport system permease protein
MLRNYIAAAFANLSRNWLYASITIAGLAVSFAAAILIGLYVRDEFSFDRFVPDYRRVYRLEMDLSQPGQRPGHSESTTAMVAGQFRLDFPEVEQVARLEVHSVGVRRGEMEAIEPIAWADPGFFRMMPRPVLAGDPNAALESPDGLVLSRALARKYFGEDAPIGKTLQVSTTLNLEGLPTGTANWFAPHTMRVLAVLKDPPQSSHLDVGMYGSGRAAVSLLALDDAYPSPFNSSALTYVKLKPGASLQAVEARQGAFANRRFAAPGTQSVVRFGLVPLADLHFTAHPQWPGLRPGGDKAVDMGIAAVGLLIIVIAAINFVTLMTARATRRSVEVGVRKVVGARRRDLIIQFLGEAVVYVLIAMLVGVALAELLLPWTNAFLGRALRFDYLDDPRLLLAIVGTAALTALLAGGYPALVISGFRPATALKGGAGQKAGSAAVRQALVIVQFAILIVLIVMTGTVYRQTSFALNDAMRLDTDQIMRIGAHCEAALKRELAGVPGVKQIACVSQSIVAGGGEMTAAMQPGHPQTQVGVGAVDVGFFEMHGLKPVAGRFFDPRRGQDVVLERMGDWAAYQPAVVLNQTAASQLGFRTPQDAIGKTISWGRWSGAWASGNRNQPPSPAPSEVIGVVPDFTLDSIRQSIPAVIYDVDPGDSRFMVVKLDGRRIPETLRAIGQVWQATGHLRPLPKEFENQIVQDQYKDVITQEIAIAVCAGLGIFIACLGLFALAAFTTERRTKEIGVRKAMGASTFDVVRLLVWQFTQPVLWANLIAWPLAWLAMRRWLDGFAYRVDLPVWLFLAAAAAAVAIAWLTVSIQSWLTARARPVLALRYE